MLPGRCVPVEFFSWKCRKLRKTAKSGYPASIWPFRTSLFSALSWHKISHMKLQSLKMFKTTKDVFYKHFFFFFANWQGRSWGFVNLVLWTMWLYHIVMSPKDAEGTVWSGSALFAQICLSENLGSLRVRIDFFFQKLNFSHFAGWIITCLRVTHFRSFTILCFLS